MFKKRLIALMLVLALACSVTPAFAQARVKSTTGIESNSSLELPANTWVYGIKLYADASNSFMAIYDAAAVAVTDTGANAIDEIGEATQYDSVEVWYPKPIKFVNGVSVIITTGVGFIFYGPAPSN